MYMANSSSLTKDPRLSHHRLLEHRNFAACLAKDAMLRIQWMSTGEDVISVDRDVLVEPSCTGIPILAIKRYLQGIIGQPRFKQRLLFDRTILDDSAEVMVPLLLHLVVLSDYCDSSPENRRQFMYAVMNNRAQELERMLSEPQAKLFFPMYGIFTYIYHKNQLKVGKYTIHGSYGYGKIDICGNQ